MALHYYGTFGPTDRLRNFGDAINPWFLPKMFRPEIIQSKRVCLVGISTFPAMERSAESINGNTRFEAFIVPRKLKLKRLLACRSSLWRRDTSPIVRRFPTPPRVMDGEVIG